MRAVSDEEVAAVLAVLLRAEIGVYIGMPTGGCMDLSAPQVAHYLKDPDLFWAGVYGCELNRYKAWCDALGTGTACTAARKGRKGGTCGNWVPAGDAPAKFDPEHALCELHSRRAAAAAKEG